jgi:hypothetical protein
MDANELSQFKLLSDEAVARFEVFVATGKYPVPSPRDPRGAFDYMPPTLRRRSGCR